MCVCILIYLKFMWSTGWSECKLPSYVGHLRFAISMLSIFEHCSLVKILYAKAITIFFSICLMLVLSSIRHSPMF